MTSGKTESLPGDSPKARMEGNIFHIAPSEVERQETADEILVRRIKNRERQRKYRARKRLEAVLQGYTAQRQTFWPTVSASDGTIFSFNSNGRTSPLEGSRVYSGKKWKKEARRVCSSTPVENPLFERQPAQVEAVVKNTSNLSGRRNWKAEARNKQKKSKMVP